MSQTIYIPQNAGAEAAAKLRTKQMRRAIAAAGLDIEVADMLTAKERDAIKLQIEEATKAAETTKTPATGNHITNQQGEPQTMTMHADAVTDLLKTNERQRVGDRAPPVRGAPAR